MYTLQLGVVELALFMGVGKGVTRALVFRNFMMSTTICYATTPLTTPNDNAIVNKSPKTPKTQKNCFVVECISIIR